MFNESGEVCIQSRSHRGLWYSGSWDVFTSRCQFNGGDEGYCCSGDCLSGVSDDGGAVDQLEIMWVLEKEKVIEVKVEYIRPLGKLVSPLKDGQSAFQEESLPDFVLPSLCFFV
jgi:hypothetical protein